MKLAKYSCLGLNVDFFWVKLQTICRFSRVERCCFILWFLSLDHWMHSVPWTHFIINLFVLLLSSPFASFKSRPYHSPVDLPLCILLAIWPIPSPQNHSFSIVFLQIEFIPRPSWTEHCKYNLVFCNWWTDKILLSPAELGLQQALFLFTLWRMISIFPLMGLSLSQEGSSLVSLLLVLTAFSFLPLG